MKNYLISELGLILETLKHYQLKEDTDIILYQELEYIIYKTEQKIKFIQDQNNKNNGSSPYQVFKSEV